MKTQPMRAGEYVMLIVTAGYLLYTVEAYLATSLLKGGGLVIGNHVPGEGLKILPLVSLDIGVMLSGPIIMIWFLRNAPKKNLRQRHLLLPTLFLAAVFSTTLWFPNRGVDGGIWSLFVLIVGILYALGAGFTAVSLLVRRRLEAAGEIPPLAPPPTRRLGWTHLAWLLILAALALTAWSLFSGLAMHVDFNPNRGFDTPFRLFMGAPTPLFIMLVGLLLPMALPMADAPRRSLYWINATAWIATFLLCAALGLMALADSDTQGKARLPAIVLGIVFAWAAWTLTSLFRFLYPPVPNARGSS